MNTFFKSSDKPWKVMLLAFGLLAFVASGCDDDDEILVEEDSLLEVIQENPQLTILETILTMPEFSALAEAAADEDSELTIFAPTDAAFANLLTTLGVSSLSDLPMSVVREIVEYHILGQELTASEITAGQAMTLQGENVNITTSGGVQVNGIPVTQADLNAENGVIHVIGGVLLPAEPTAVAGTILAPAYFSNNFTILVEALRTAGLIDDLLGAGPFTVFAPTNDAFAAAGITSLEGIANDRLMKILQYHVVSGEVMASELTEGAVATLAGMPFYVSLTNDGAFLNGNSEVVTTNLEYSNGVVHVINRTLLPPSQNLVQIVQALAGASNGAEFTQLLAAVLRVSQNGGMDLVAALSNEDAFYTVFAPTDAAFQKVYDADNGINSINDIPVATLQNILLTHVVASPEFTPDLSTAETFTPLLNSQTLVAVPSVPAIAVQNSNQAVINIPASNVLATNGVIHVISDVLIPAN